MAFVRAASFGDVPEGGMLGVETGGQKLALAKVEGQVYAFADNCTHRDFPLHSGELDADECTVTCDWHGAQFDIRTGAALCLPATRPVAVYEVRVDGDDVMVDVGA